MNTPEPSNRGERKQPFGAGASPGGEGPHSGHLSLEGMHGTVAVPHPEAGFWRQWRAFIRPAILITVGYMDPGQWGTGLAGGAQFQIGVFLGAAPAPFVGPFVAHISSPPRVVAGQG